MSISDKNRFVTGSKDGHVTIWTDAKPFFKRVYENATRVKYNGHKIYAVGRQQGKLTVLNMDLETIKVVDHASVGSIEVLVVTEKYVAVGDALNIGDIQIGYVNVFDKDGRRVLVSCV